MCLNDLHIGIRTTAGEVLLQLFDSRIIERWGSGENLMITFWKLSSDVIISIARQLGELKCTDDKTRFLLELLQQLMTRRNMFLKDHQVGRRSMRKIMWLCLLSSCAFDNVL